MSKLTIGIPTFERAEDLDRLLESLLIETQDIETGIVDILVSDNASNDHTSSVVAKHQQSCPHISYVRNKHNIGMQMNFWQCMSICSGEYLYLIGDDETVKPGAISLILERIASLSLPLYVYNLTNEVRPQLNPFLQEVYGKPIETDISILREFVFQHGWLWTLGNLGLVVARVADLRKLDPTPHCKHTFMQAALYFEAFHDKEMIFVNQPVIHTYIKSQTINKTRWEHDGNWASWPYIADSLDAFVTAGLLPELLPLTFFNGCSTSPYPLWNYFLDRIINQVLSGNIGIADEQWNVASNFMRRVADVNQRRRLLDSLETLRSSVHIARSSLENTARLVNLLRQTFLWG